MIDYLRDFDSFCLLDNNVSNNTSFDFLVAFKKEEELINSSDPFLDLERLINQSSDWLFGYLTYDLKNYIEALSSNNLDFQKFPLFIFLVPQL